MLALGVLLALLVSINAAAAQDALPRPDPTFNGLIGRTAAESTPDFPAPARAPKGAPNVLLVLTDDVGFGASSAFGGPIPTPTLDRLARSGLRYNQFHTTALCSPTRAALITGRNHHTAASGTIMEFATGYPGYNSQMPRSVGTIAEVLRQNGYGTAWFGKNHNVPDWQTSQAGPFDLWPTRLGFDYFFGFLGGDTDQWHSALYENTRPLEAAEQRGSDPAHLDQLLADRTIDWIRLQDSMAPDRPFFVYYATGTAHAPHHAPKLWIEKFEGQFDQGWDQVRVETFERQKRLGVIPPETRLTPRPDGIPAWDSLSLEQKRLYARMMEVYAGALAHADQQIGRVIDAIDTLGRLDDTIVIFIQGDNGASAEGTLQGTTNEVATAANGVKEELPYLLSMIDELGGPMTYNHYPVGWAHAMDTPFQWTKQVASHFGGTRNGLVICWPTRIRDKGSIRPQFHHVVDIVPTILEVTGLEFPSSLNGAVQRPLEGVSMAYTFDDASAPSRRTTQYFELAGNRAIYQDGWIASTTPLRLPWVTAGGDANPDEFTWELYDVRHDFSQAEDLAASNPAKLEDLQQAFDREARRHHVYPLDASFAERANPVIRPSVTRGRSSFTYFPGMVRIPEASTPDVKNRSYAVSADVEIPAGGASGILATQGGRFGGWVLMLLDGKPTFVYALSNQPQHKYKVASSEPLAPGRHAIRFEFAYDGGGLGKGGTGRLFVDGAEVAEGRIPQTVRFRFSLDETFDVGRDTGTPVVEDYATPFAFGGTLENVNITLR